MGISENRFSYILEKIENEGSVTISEAAKELNVSDMTIRRDLNELEKRGNVRRVHGGAVDARGRSYEPPLILRNTHSTLAKRMIGKYAAEMVVDGDSIALDVGSTTQEVSNNLVKRKNLTIITPSLQIANLLSDNPSIRVLLSGGVIRRSEKSCTGDTALRVFENVYVDKLFLAVAGIDAIAGLTEYNWDDTMVKRAMIKCAKEVILVADSSKFDFIAFGFIASLDKIHAIVTENMPSGILMERINELNIQVHIANPDLENK